MCGERSWIEGLIRNIVSNQRGCLKRQPLFLCRSFYESSARTFGAIFMLYNLVSGSYHLRITNLRKRFVQTDATLLTSSIFSFNFIPLTKLCTGTFIAFRRNGNARMPKGWNDKHQR